MSKLNWRDVSLMAIFELGKATTFYFIFTTDHALPKNEGIIMPMLIGLVLFVVGQIAVLETGGK